MSDDWTTKKIDKYVVVNKKLGSGTYGVVYRGFLMQDESKQVGVKTIPLKVLSDSPKMLELIKREIAILQKIQHPNIVRLFDVARTSNYLYLILEYCADGDLREYLNKKEEKRLSEVETVIFMKHIIEGFKKLYKSKIIHRDIKPANILLHNGVAKITDFGFARVVETEMNDPAYLSRVGSPLYMAPQILEGQPFSAKCDVWSVGVMFYELLYGSTPWTGENALTLLDNIKKKVKYMIFTQFNQPLQFPSKPVRSQKVKFLISQMLQVNEKDRITWDSIFSDPMIKLDEDKIRKNLEVIKKSEDHQWRSISLNQLYIEQNLVIGYLANNPINMLEKQYEELDELSIMKHEATLSSQYDSEQAGQMIMSKYRQEQKKRDTLMKYYLYFLFERNTAFFFNFVLQKIIALNKARVLNLNEDNYFRLIYVIMKNQIIHLERVNRQLQTKQPEKFDVESWGRFLTSFEYKKILQLVKEDIEHMMNLNGEISKSCYEVQRLELEKNNKNSIINKVLEILNNEFEATEKFHSVYRDIINDNINLLMKSAPTKETQLLLFYLKICLNPYDQFQNINFDFNKFYEDNENLTENEMKMLSEKKK